ncbi:NADP-dependent oxidoreductase [Rhodomicrobium vannielii ATCC 17100]|uniref:NADP-dependent oxidoreductase n=1 Tax=Rhodomicrobium vannielii TaxID=1069 RepID=UPI0019180756|nr:NADP-dependent oxidoreductase [Rhodomicrobium vannielii]MBJ7533184.1 NADP-dependent oxidoreductase [Rhodomicrobium vannielii ATCC 17100]
MRAVVLDRFGSIENLQVKDLPIPEPGVGEVLVRIAAGSLNPIDVKTRTGQGAANFAAIVPPIVLGWDLSGTVVACGAEAGDWRPGDAVFGSIGFPGLGRTNADYTVARADHLARKPPPVTHEQAAAAAMAGQTAWQALTRHGRPAGGQKVLVQAASGGVGHMAVQIAKQFGADVTGTSSASNRDFVLSLGADTHIDYRNRPIETYPRDFDMVFDAVGGNTTLRSLALLKEDGLLVSILPPNDEIVAEEAVRTGRRFHFVLMQSSAADMTAVAHLLASGAIRPHVSQRFALTDLGRAHALQETGRSVGKIVILN